MELYKAKVDDRFKDLLTTVVQWKMQGIRKILDLEIYRQLLFDFPPLMVKQ